MVTKNEIKKIIAEMDVLMNRIENLEKGNASFEINYAMAELECSKDWLLDAVDKMEGKTEV